VGCCRAEALSGLPRSGIRRFDLMNLEDVSRAALDLEGVRESSVKGRLRWTLAGRLVARQIDDSSIVIRTGFAEREQLLLTYPSIFFVPPRFDAHMMVVAELANADPAVVEEAVQAAWDLQRSGRE
jgi:hypothetical protein